MRAMPPSDFNPQPTIKHSINAEKYLNLEKDKIDFLRDEKSQEFVVRKCISSEFDINSWLSSIAFDRFMRFVIKCNESVKNKKISDVKLVGQTLVFDRLLAVLDEMEQWTREIPLKDMSTQRFGNLAFRDWHDRLESSADRLVLHVLGEEKKALVPHFHPYFSGSFGDKMRIDYGSGHEVSFVAFLAGLELVDLASESDFPVIVLKVFVRYLEMVRLLQETYRLEPAGSHGVWGLDDYQFIPFLWGSSQLFDHPKIQPKSILNQDIVSTYAKEYMYLSCISFITKMKKGHFFEHSPMLYDISGVPNWHKVNGGMIKMYLNEVLTKVPVIQHFPFGLLFPFDPSPT